VTPKNSKLIANQKASQRPTFESRARSFSGAPGGCTNDDCAQRRAFATSNDSHPKVYWKATGHVDKPILETRQDTLALQNQLRADHWNPCVCRCVGARCVRHCHHSANRLHNARTDRCTNSISCRDELQLRHSQWWFRGTRTPKHTLLQSTLFKHTPCVPNSLGTMVTQCDNRCGWPAQNHTH
jgi:hypothetical protein